MSIHIGRTLFACLWRQWKLVLFQMWNNVNYATRVCYLIEANCLAKLFERRDFCAPPSSGIDKPKPNQHFDMLGSKICYAEMGPSASKIYSNFMIIWGNPHAENCARIFPGMMQAWIFNCAFYSLTSQKWWVLCVRWSLQNTVRNTFGRAHAVGAECVFHYFSRAPAVFFYSKYIFGMLF